MESDSDDVTVIKPNNRDGAHFNAQNKLTNCDGPASGSSNAQNDNAVGSLERIYKAALQYPNNTMSMWRPNLSQIARDEV
jgi:hypothetical protein